MCCLTCALLALRYRVGERVGVLISRLSSRIPSSFPSSLQDWLESRVEHFGTVLRLRGEIARLPILAAFLAYCLSCKERLKECNVRAFVMRTTREREQKEVFRTVDENIMGRQEI